MDISSSSSVVVQPSLPAYLKQAPFIAAGLVKRKNINLAFTLLEVGALPIASDEEPFHRLMQCFPASRLIAFEVDAALCEKLNASAAPGVRFYPVPLGIREETRTFHETKAPMCGSLYVPDERYADLFQQLDVMRLEKTCQVRTSSMDAFVAAHGIGNVDFIKIDVQGAELEIFQGARKTLAGVSCIISEVEFVPLYKDQPLFGDVDAFLRGEGFLFHKFLGLCGRAMKPIVMGGNDCAAVQHMWSDAVFVRSLLAPEELADEQLLKLAILMEIYGSVDVSAHFLRAFDRRRGTRFAEEFLAGYGIGI